MILLNYTKPNYETITIKLYDVLSVSKILHYTEKSNLLEKKHRLIIQRSCHVRASDGEIPKGSFPMEICKGVDKIVCGSLIFVLKYALKT